jgi:hypothetical protein
MTRPAGMSVSSITLTVVSRPLSDRERSTTNADNATSSRILPSSEAWKEKKPTSIARRDPRATVPSACTARIDRMSIP